MKNINLTQVTTLVWVAFTASFFVSADDSSAELNQTSSALVQDQFIFSSLDTDKDGSLSKEEVKASKNKLLAKSFKEIDSNDDGLLSKAELVDFVETAKVESDKIEHLKS
jgi:Ca2+-binding EF-hand superfamily protein